MPDESDDQRDSAGAWAKHYHQASRSLMESILRDHDLGPTQWYVLWQLVNVGPTIQRDLGPLLRIERATLSGIVAALVRKGLVAQVPDAVDQRQRVLTITDAGRALWDELPDPVALTTAISFDAADEVELETTRRVLREATGRLIAYMAEADGARS